MTTLCRGYFTHFFIWMYWLTDLIRILVKIKTYYSAILIFRVIVIMIGESTVSLLDTSTIP